MEFPKKPSTKTKNFNYMDILSQSQMHPRGIEFTSIMENDLLIATKDNLAQPMILETNSMRMPHDHKITLSFRLAIALLLGVGPMPVAFCAQVVPPKTIEAALAQPAATWAQRSSPQNETKARDEFLDMLVLDGSIRIPPLIEITTLAKTDKTKAFDAYLNYFLERLRNAPNNGLSDALIVHEKPPADDATLKTADELMLGIINLDRKTINIGGPGSVDWSAPWDTNTVYPAQVALHTTQVFLPLGRAFLLTNDHKYLDRWMGYLEDWALNDDYFDRLHPLLVPDHINSSTGASILNLLSVLSHVTEPARKANETLSGRVLAEVIQKFLQKSLLFPVTYIRSNTHNWTPSTRQLQIALLFEDFKPSQFYFREGLRRNVEDNAVTQNLRDGTENQQDPWYNQYYLDLAGVFRLLQLDSHLPGWNELRKDYSWYARMRRHFNDRATYLIHDRTPQNNLPLGWNGGYNRTPEFGEYWQAPAAFEDPTNRAIIRAVNGDKNADPGYTSDWFPYAGFNLVREAWDKTSGVGAMFTSPQPGAYGAFRSRSNNNTFTLSAFGQDLLIDDATGHYMYPNSPLTVDGRNQFFHVGIYKVAAPASHKVFQVNAWLEPANWRWHSSDNFNLMEGIYSGAYANNIDAKRVQGKYGTDESQSGTMPAGSGINDVSHQRLALFVRGANLWVIDDRLHTHGAHEYAQQWLFPLRPADTVSPKEVRTGPSFAAAKITTDATTQKIATNEAMVPVKKDDQHFQEVPKANLSLYQFSAMPITYSATPKPRDKEYNYYMYYGWDRVESKWKGTGDQQVVTLAFPRAPGTGPEGDLKSAKRITGGKNGIGFEAITPDGKSVKYLSSILKDDILKLDDVTMMGESLLVSGTKGIALGASRLSIKGKEVRLPTPDVEFDLTASMPHLMPIYRPISPVEIGPPQNVFNGRVLVSLNSKTPGVELRYTLDGTEPTPQSTLYTTPFEITKTTTVLARAYRPGTKENPRQLSGTEATVVSSACFESSGLVPSVAPVRPETGLVVSYYEGDWKKLMLDLDAQNSTATKKGVNLWDTDVIPTSNPLVEKDAGAHTKNYALVYSGFLKVPVSGVYTLTAPQEYVWPATDAGYDLRISLGNKMGSGVFSGRVVGVNEWYPATTLHAFGSWSIALEQGLHPFRVAFIDYRTDGVKKLNKPGLTKYIWDGATPKLEISGPDMKEQPIPASMLMRPMEKKENKPK